MTVRVLVVDDEPDVETLFRQQFRREVRQGLYTMDLETSLSSNTYELRYQVREARHMLLVCLKRRRRLSGRS